MAPSPVASLTKGQNAPVPAGSVVVTVECAAPADLSALLVNKSGKVRTDADFVFYNQPDGPGVKCVPPSSPGGQWQIQINPSQVPAAIAQIRTVITLADPGRRFADVPPPTARLLDAQGLPVAEFVITGLQAESIVIALEVYRRGDAWKVRAVGQGYAGGFAALVTDHGVSVDDDAAAGSPAPAAYPPPGAAAPAYPPRGAPAGGFPPPGAPAPAYPPPGAPAGGFPPPGAYPPPGAPAGGFPPPAAYPPPGAPAGGFPPPAAYPPPGQPAAAYPPPGGHSAPPAAPAAPSGEISLRKGARVDLSKGQRVSLRKEDGSTLTRVRMGLAWDPARRNDSIDLDASAILFAGTQRVDIVAYTQLQSHDGSIRHSGDNLTGEGGGDDEVISVDLNAVHPQVTTIAFVVTSYRGQTFDQVRSAYCRLVDDVTGTEMVRFTLDGGIRTTGMVMAVLQRGANGWRMEAIGAGVMAKLPKKAAEAAVPYLPAI